jgi:signal transduction histidine kinase
LRIEEDNHSSILDPRSSIFNPRSSTPMKAPADHPDLPWLVPCAGSLAALARCPAPAAWERLRADPGAVLYVVRQVPEPRPPTDLALSLDAPGILDAAVRFLRTPRSGFVDWSQPPAQPFYQASLALARVARRLAEITTLAAPETAWVCGLLAPLGWLASCATGTAAEPDTALALARRLARSWQLPPWLAAVTAHLGLPADTALELGADIPLFRITQFAVALVQERWPGNPVKLPVPVSGLELADALRLAPADLARLAGEVDTLVGQAPPAHDWTDPHGQPLLLDLLELAAENRRLRACPVRCRLEQEAETLHRALEGLHAGEAERLRRQKLNSLAEMAAGAGHEINNPLAVISGQAQYLLHKLSEPDQTQQKALQTIIQQCQDIHQILRDLRLFARPPRPRKQPLDLLAAIRQSASALGELAGQRSVNLLIPELLAPLEIQADPDQVQTILSCLLRNAIEAAPTGGWARVRLESSADAVDILIEDNGSGPEPGQREHLFDPFFAGRQAGRGTGLGLSIAWALARQHGGDVRLASALGGPTCFVLTLPTSTKSEIPNGKSQGNLKSDIPISETWRADALGL